MDGEKRWGRPWRLDFHSLIQVDCAPGHPHAQDMSPPQFDSTEAGGSSHGCWYHLCLQKDGSGGSCQVWLRFNPSGYSEGYGLVRFSESLLYEITKHSIWFASSPVRLLSPLAFQLTLSYIASVRLGYFLNPNLQSDKKHQDKKVEKILTVSLDIWENINQFAVIRMICSPYL